MMGLPYEFIASRQQEIIWRPHGPRHETYMSSGLPKGGENRTSERARMVITTCLVGPSGGVLIKLKA